MAKLVTARWTRVESITLADGLTTTRKLPSDKLWFAIQMRMTGTFAPSGSTAGLDSDLNIVSAVILRANGTQIFRLSPNVQYFRSTYQNRTALQRTAAGNATTAVNWSVIVPLSLPYPVKPPIRHATALPAGCLNNIELEVQCPASLTSAIYSTPGSAAITSAILDVSILALDWTSEQCKSLVRKAGHAYIQEQKTITISGASALDTELTGGSGVLLDLFVNNVNNTLHSDAIATTTQVLIGSDDTPVSSTFLSLQDASKQLYQVENTPTGCWLIPFNPDGMPDQGYDLNGKPSVKLRQTFGSPTSVARSDCVQGTFYPGLYQRIANL